MQGGGSDKEKDLHQRLQLERTACAERTAVCTTGLSQLRMCEAVAKERGRERTVLVTRLSRKRFLEKWRELGM